MRRRRSPQHASERAGVIKFFPSRPNASPQSASAGKKSFAAPIHKTVRPRNGECAVGIAIGSSPQMTNKVYSTGAEIIK